MSIWPERIAAQTELHLSVISSFAFDSKDQKYRTVDSQEYAKFSQQEKREAHSQCH